MAASATMRWPAVRRMDANSGRNGPGTFAAIGADACLAESKSQQARAEEHEAGCGQGKKSVGDFVVVAHETPTTQMLVRIY
jgi:hypothetical protein